MNYTYSPPSPLQAAVELFPWKQLDTCSKEKSANLTSSSTVTTHPRAARYISTPGPQKE